jgi:hypothetical protein
LVDSVTGLSGYIWGNALGWINLNPTGQGVRFANSTTGLLEGKAWSQVSGWINFGVSGQPVTINPSTGEFSGWAWTGGPEGGWIKFDCGDSSSCVKTTWRNSSNGGGGGVPLIDVCANIDGLQTSIPVGFTVDKYGKCTKSVDLCPNILGDQVQIPSGYTYDDFGFCVPEALDYCKNIDGAQRSVPNNYFLDEKGDCVVKPKDYCPNDQGIQSSYDECSKKEIDVCINLPGLQRIAPSNYTLVNGSCFENSFDFCPNIVGTQFYIPENMTVSSDGNCVKELIDICRNLSGAQEELPIGFEKEGEDCLFIQTKNDEEVRVIAFSFIPKNIQIASSNFVLKEGVRSIDKVVKKDLTSKPYMVDLVSTSILVLSLILLIILIILTIRFIKKRLTHEGLRSGL